MSVQQVLVKMHGTAPVEFLLSYLGLGLFGVAIAKFYLVEGIWSVAVFLAPLGFAPQMYFGSRPPSFSARQRSFRTRAPPEQRAERNELLGEQATRLESLLEHEHATVDEL